MPADTREWTVPAPLRALLWWPAAAFVLVMIAPQAATESIALAGAALVTLGVIVSTMARRLRRTVGPELLEQDGRAGGMATLELSSTR